MNSKRDLYKRIVTFGAAVILLGVITGIFAFFWYRYYSEAIVLPYYRRGNWVLIGIYGLLTALFFKAYGGFKVGYLKKTDMLYSQSLSMICVNTVAYLLISLIGRHFMNVFPILMMTLADFAFIAVWTFVSGKIFFLLYPPRKLVILYGSRQAAALVLKMSRRIDKYMICESVSADEKTEKIKELMQKYEGVIICDLPAEQRNDFLKYCFENSIRAYITPKISDIMLRSAEEIHLFDTSLLLSRNTGLSAEQQFCKRAFDIVFSLVFLVVFSPFMLLIALAIRLCDGGPVFFTQDRLTQDGKVFKLYKFRSMYVNQQPTEYCMTRENDSRITPVGKIIRNIHFDELPQIINILKGDMSFVGPRPECPDLAAEYQQIVPEFDFRLKMKAGLTGFAQVYGKYNTTPLDKLKLDLVYIENYSFLLDLKLILLTFKILFQKENTEGIKDWQTSAATAENLEKIGKQQ